MTVTEIDELIEALPIHLERDEFVSEALLPILPTKLEFEALLYLFRNPSLRSRAALNWTCLF